MTSATVHSSLPGGEALGQAAPEFQTALATWYRVHHRRLPWRTSPSLYRTVVSEMMLQQTRIDTALPFFDRWMKTLPDFAAVAAAPEEQVLKLWEGLGYYRRARHLHRLAREIEELPEVPTSPTEWQNFTGIGPYSAAAITSIAFNAPAACVDGNVVRVLARLIGYDLPLKDTSSAARLFQPLAQQMLDTGDPGSHNQAMMELGATVCQRNPACGSCPVAEFCAGRRSGNAAGIPVFPPRRIEKVAVARVWTERGGNLLLAQPGRDARRLAQLYELPSCEQLGLTAQETEDLGTLLLTRKRSITRFSITENIYRVDDTKLTSPPIDGLTWVALKDLNRIAFSGPHRRWVDAILAEREN